MKTLYKLKTMRALARLSAFLLLFLALSGSALAINQYPVRISTTNNCPGATEVVIWQCYGAQGAWIFQQGGETGIRYHLQIWNTVLLVWEDVGGWKATSPCVNFGLVNTDGTYRILANEIGTGNYLAMLNTVDLHTYPIFVAGTANNPNPTICYNDKALLPLTATDATGGWGGANPLLWNRSYTWQFSSDNLTYNDIPGTTTINAPSTYLIPGNLITTTYYRVRENDLHCGELRYTAPVSVPVYDEYFAGLAYNQDYTLEEFKCGFGDDYQDILADIPDGGSGFNDYQWQIHYETDPPDFWTDLPGETTLALYGYLIPVDVNKSFRCRQIDTYCLDTVYTNAVNKLIYLEASSIACCDQTMCFGEQADFLHATNPTGGSGEYTFKWQTAPTIGGPWVYSWGEITNLDYSPGYMYSDAWFRLEITDVKCPGNVGHSNPVFIHVFNEFQPGYAYPYIQTICYGHVPDPIHATPPSGGSGSPSYQWESWDGTDWVDIFGETDLDYQPGALISTQYYRMRYYDDACYSTVYSNYVTIYVNPLLGATVNSTHVTCNGSCDGTITITNPFGGGDGYEFSIDGGITWSSLMTYTGLCTGYYDVQIRDAEMISCVVDLGTVYIPAPDPLFSFFDYTDITCYKTCDGSFTFYGSTGGWDGYEYSIDGGSTWQTSPVFTGLCAGSYNLWMRDALNPDCIATGYWTLLEPDPLDAEIAYTHVTCAGSCDGTITISNPEGGWDGYEFSIDGGLTWSVSMTYTGLCTGYYEVMMRDAANPNCDEDLGTIFIPAPDPISGSYDWTNTTCYGTCDGTITFFNIGGGWDGYEYSIDNGLTWQTTSVYTGLCPGTYDLIVRDASNPDCRAYGTVYILGPDELEADVDYTNITCWNVCDGTITITNPEGGWDGYEFSIDGGLTWSTTMSYTGLCGGWYYVWMRDALNLNIPCAVHLEDIFIETPGALDASFDYSYYVSCFGTCDGYIHFSNPVGGWDGYEFSIDGGLTWSANMTFDGLCAGSYVLYMRDASNPNCMVGPQYVFIDTPYPLNAEVESTDVTCSGSCDGTIEISNPTGGFGYYEFSIDGGLTWSFDMNYTGLCTGWYSVWMRDYYYPTCTLYLGSIYIDAPLPLTFDYNMYKETCADACDGWITFSNPGGGWDAYEFSIDNGLTWSNNMDYYNLCQGTYILWMRDAMNINCLAGPVTVVIDGPGALSADIASTHVTCWNVCDGTITISNPLGGWDGYEFSIDGGLTWSTNMSYLGLCGGTYEIWMRDASFPNCLTHLQDVIIETPGILNSYFNWNQVTCFGTCDGYIHFSNPTGGWDGYEFTIDGGLTWSSNMIYDGLCTGWYYLNMRDASNPNCTQTDYPVFIETPQPLYADVAFTHVTCDGSCDGTITITNPTGGFGYYEFSIDGGLTWSAAMDYTGLCTGYYDVQIRDYYYPTCIVDLGTIFIPAPDPLFSSFTPVDISCYGSCDGSITFYGTIGGWDGYEFSVDGGTTWQTSPAFTGLCPGDYDVRVRDASNPDCMAYGYWTLIQPDSLSADVAYTHVTCAGSCDGTITISNPAGGWDGFEFSIDGGLTWSTSMIYTGLCSGSYDIQIRDASYPACIRDLGTIFIPEPGYLDAFFYFGNITCNGVCDGYFDFFDPIGGWDGYEFSIDGGLTWTASTYFGGLCAGDYHLMVRDASNPNCTVGRWWTLYQPDLLEADVDYTNVTCYGYCDGTITFSNPEGGWDGYEFSIDGGLTWSASLTYTGLCGGYYHLFIRDAQNTTCMVDLGTINIEVPDFLYALVSVTNTTCYGVCDGSITFSNPVGGWDGYEFSIDGGLTWSANMVYTGLCPGYYSIMMRDALNPNCINYGYGYIYGPPELGAELTSTHVTCFGSCDGTITVLNPFGGWDGYEFSIDYGITWQTSTSFTGLCSGWYDVYMRDASNPACSVWIDDLYIDQPLPLDGYFTWTNLTCHDVCNGTITFYNFSGGWDGYEFSIDGGLTWSASPVFTGLCEGTYSVALRDAENPLCMIGGNTAYIVNPDQLTADVNSTHVTCYGACDGTITISNPFGGWDGYEFSIDGGLTWSTTMAYTGLCGGTYSVWMRDPSSMIPGSTGYVYCVQFLGDVNIPVPDPLHGWYNQTDVTCAGSCDGSIHFYDPTGGWDGYEWTIDGGLTWSANMDYTGLCEGLYLIGIRDASNPNCYGFSETIIIAPDSLDADLYWSNVTCYGYCNGTITISNPTGGWDGYEFSIDGGLTWSTNMYYYGLCPGYYNVVMRDALYPTCMVEINGFFITEPPLVVPTITGPTVVCLNTTVTYTTEAGMMGYVWNVSAGGVVTGGLGSNEITVEWVGTGAQTVCVDYMYGQYYCPGHTCIDVFVNPLPVVHIYGPDPVCEDYEVTYTTEAGMNNYFWDIEPYYYTLVAGGGSTDNFITVKFTDPFVFGIFVSYTDGNGCYGSATKFVTVEPTPDFTITGPNPVCQYQEGAVYCVNLIDPIPGHFYTYQWVVTDNGDGLSTFTGQNSPCITVDWGNGTAGQVSCIVTDMTDDLHCSRCVILPIVINPLPDPHIIGCLEVTVGDICCYHVEQVPGWLYNWTVNCGEIQDCGCGYETCIHWLTAGTCTLTLCVTNLETGCSNCVTFTVIVHPGTKVLDGYITYNNTYNTELNGITVQLRDIATNAIVATTISDVNTETWMAGYYSFPNLAPGTYKLNAFHSADWSGVNATDALIDQLVFLGLYSFNHFDSIIGNVNADAAINPTDALWIKMRSIDKINYFPAGDWKFNNTPTILVHNVPPVTHYDFKGACVGDVNYSNIPLFKAAPAIGIINEGVVNILPNESFNYNVRLSHAAELGAMTLFLNYDQNLVEVEEVVSSPEGTQFTLGNGTLNIAWSDPNALSLSETDAILTLKLKAKVENADASELFTVKAGSEFADQRAGVINNLDLKMGSISTMTAGSYSLSNYPNPFRNSTTISYVLPEQGHVKLVVTNMYGETIKTLVDADQVAGNYQVVVNPSEINLSSGVYLYKIDVNGVSTFFTKTNKMVLSR